MNEEAILISSHAEPRVIFINSLLSFPLLSEYSPSSYTWSLSTECAVDLVEFNG
jgi:hypothetical protein